MNWKEIKEKYPKAFRKAEIYGHVKVIYTYGDGGRDGCDLGYKNIRNLYDFFDENDIIIEIGLDCTIEPKYCYKVHEYYDSRLDWYTRRWSDLWLRRQEAEKEAFKKAFEILEDKL